MLFNSTQRKILVSIAALISLVLARQFSHADKPQAQLIINNPVVEEYALVRRVIDGDTIVLWNSQKLRYIGVNTPETKHEGRPDEFYGRQASAFNKKLVLGKRIRLEFDQARYDKYNRLLAYVYLEDGTFVNAELVKQGYARVMSIKPNTRYYGLFKKLQAEAKAERLGIWAK